MSAGLYPATTVAQWLGKKPQELARVIKEDGLPAINVPTRQKVVTRFALLALHRWVKARSLNSALSLEELEQEIDRAAAAVAARRTVESGKQKTETEVAA